MGNGLGWLLTPLLALLWPATGRHRAGGGLRPRGAHRMRAVA
ncbi:hypothetical protein [Wenjunlia vitaminophila]|nr:hypothetical protein [Wenjunlia vitaminophila]